MDDQKKQKVLIAVLSVLVLGAGGYYFVIRDSGPSNSQVQSTGPVVRRERAEAPVTERRDRTTERSRQPQQRSAIQEMVERRERQRDETPQRVERRERRGEKREQVKKKEMAPAA